MKDLTTTMDITMTAEEEEELAAATAAAEADGEFPGTDEALKESMKTADGEKPAPAAAAAAAGAGAGAAVAPPTVKVEDDNGVAAGEKPTTTPAATGDKPAASPRPSVSGTTPSRTSSPAPSGTSTPRKHGIPLRPALMDRASDDVAAAAAEGGGDASLHKKDVKDKKKSGLTKEQREKLAEYERERARVRQERVDMLAKKLLDRISVWAETDKGADVTKAFQEKIRLEVENLKMESFGIDILHAIGQTYLAKGTNLLKSQKLFGIGGFFGRMKDKGTIVKETWNTISSAIDAQQTMEEMSRMEERGGEDWTDEMKMEYERRVTGKILNAAWRGSKFEIQSVLREVCDTVLNDKKVSLAKRLERAQAMVIIGEICAKVCFAHLVFPFIHFLISPSFAFPLSGGNNDQTHKSKEKTETADHNPRRVQAQRSPEEEGDFMAFEQLVAEAAIKKEKEKDKEERKKKKHGHGHAAEGGAEASTKTA